MKRHGRHSQYLTVLTLLSTLFVSVLVVPSHSSKQLEISRMRSRVTSSSAPIQPSWRNTASLDVQQIAEPSSVLLDDNFDSENEGFGSLNYFGLRNWNVTAGSVDLIGNGFADSLPGNGLYLDLDGTTSQAGTIESKTTFTLVPGTYRLEFSLAGSQLGDLNRVDVRLGDVYTETFTPPSDAPFTLIRRDIIVTTATSGKLVFQSFGGDNMGYLLDNVRLLTDITEPRLFNVTPDHGGNVGTVTATLGGINFPLGPINVRLTGQGQNDIVAINATVIAATQIVATFDLTEATAGLRDVVVTLSTQESMTLQDAFTVEPGGDSQLWVDILGRGTIRPGRPQTFTIVYGNHGNSDAYAVPLWLAGIPINAEVSVRTPLTEPAPNVGAPPIDWKQVPEFVEANGEKLMPLLLPVIPPDTPGAINITLQINTDQSFQLKTSVSPPLVRSLAQDALTVTDCSLAVTEEILRIAGLIPGVSCLEATRQLILSKFIGAAHDAVHERRTGETENRVISFVEASVDFAHFAARCAGGEIPGSTVWELGQIAIGGIQIFRDCQEPFQRLRESTLPVSVVNSRDPNDKVGSTGAGVARYVSGQEPLRYAIYFENVATATAPAQEVVITDQLDSVKLDLNTFSLGPIAFGNQLVNPPQDSSEFNQDVDLRPANNLIVRINAALDKDTGRLTWRFASIDPTTGLPTEDPLAGFLPPNVNAPEGDGSVLFTVMPKEDLLTGTEIRNQAQIIFDANAPIDTPQWFNTLDNSAPASNVHALSSISCSANINVQWSGIDTGSGVRDYTVYVSDNGGSFAVWQSHTTATSGTYSGQFGHTYAFYSVAQDQTGNIENVPGSPDASVTVVDNTPPSLSVPTLAPVSTNISCKAVIPDVVSGSNAADNCSGPVTITQNPTAGTLVGAGSHTITVTATDVAGNSKNATINFTVIAGPSFTVNVTPSSVKRGKEVTFRTAFKNCAGSRQTLTLKVSLTRPGSNTLMVTLPLVLQAGQAGSLNIPVTIPKSTPTGVYSLTLDVFVGGIRIGTSTAQLTVTH